MLGSNNNLVYKLCHLIAYLTSSYGKNLRKAPMPASATDSDPSMNYPEGATSQSIILPRLDDVLVVGGVREFTLVS